MGRLAWSLGLLAAASMGGLWHLVVRSASVRVELDVAERRQTIRGWGATVGAQLASLPEHVLASVLDEAVDELGLTRLRLEPDPRWEWENDDADPESIDWERIDTTRLDELVRAVVLPFRARVEARGDPFELYLSPSFYDSGRTGRVPPWLLESPGEYAEYATSLLLHLRDVHGLEPAFFVICNEPGHDNAFRPEHLARLVPAVGERFEQLGFATRIQLPECINPSTSWAWVRKLRGEEEVWRHVGALSWHLYGKEWRAERRELRELAAELGLPTAQTEFMNATAGDLFQDLTLGDVSYWEYYGLASRARAPRPGDYLFVAHDGSTLLRTREYWRFRQVMHHVRPGDVRVECESDDRRLKAMAFDGADGVAVCLQTPGLPLNGARVELSGLRSGTYGLSHAAGGRPVEEQAPLTVDVDGRATLALPADCVATLYARPEHDLGPTITRAEASPAVLSEPGGCARLTVHATDAEGDALRAWWNLLAWPEGGEGARLERDAGTSARACGLDAPGWYGFRVEVGDGRHSSKRDVWVQVVEGNRAPVLGELTNRAPVRPDTDGAQTKLGIGAHDPDGDELSYGWTVAAAPAGAAPRFEDSNAASTRVEGLTAPGRYLFRVTVSDGPSETLAELAVDVRERGRAPRILALEARREEVLGGELGHVLVAETEDPDGGAPSCWWRFLRGPEGARPYPLSAGRPRTVLRGLDRPGTYVFELSVVDADGFARDEVSVTVE